MINPFEQPQVQSPEMQLEAAHRAQKILDGSKIVFVRDAAHDAFTAKRYGNTIHLKIDAEHGMFYVDIDLGVTLPEGREADLWALANFYRSFRFKFGDFTTCPVGSLFPETFSWTTGESVHFFLQSSIGAWSDTELLGIPGKTASEFKETFERLAAGTITLEEASQEPGGIDRFRDFMRRSVD